MTPAWKRLVISMAVLLVVLAYIVFKLINYVLWWLQYDHNTGSEATLGMLDTAPGQHAAILFGATCTILVLFNVMPLILKRG
jgi:uncharacterized membrane-anchored protein